MEVHKFKANKEINARSLKWKKLVSPKCCSVSNSVSSQCCKGCIDETKYKKAN